MLFEFTTYLEILVMHLESGGNQLHIRGLYILYIFNVKKILTISVLSSPKMAFSW